MGTVLDQSAFELAKTLYVDGFSTVKVEGGLDSRIGIVPDEVPQGSTNLAPLNALTHPATQSSGLLLKEVSPLPRIVHHFWGVEAGYVKGPESLPKQSVLCVLQNL